MNFLNLGLPLIAIAMPYSSYSIIDSEPPSIPDFSWLHDCELKHKMCRPLIGQLPKRLIDVGSQDGRPPRLVMSEDLYDLNIRYASLSYR
jgi:hypothetical protein